MELELIRVDYTIVGLTTPKCMRLLPPSGSKSQKVVIGDQSGILHIFAVKKGEIQSISKISGDKITRLDLGGPSDGPNDKIFISCNSEVRGFTKKGKPFLCFDTNLTETIQTMCVMGNNLFVSGQNSLYHYQDLKDVNNFFCGGVIKDVILISSLNANTLNLVLACDDKVIRIVEDSCELYSIPILSTPTVLHHFSTNEGSSQVIYGTSDGGVGMLCIGRELKNSWLLEPDFKKGQVTTLDTFDITGDGFKELIAGRDDGFIEVYKLNQEDDIPKLIYSYTCNETVTCLVCGTVGSNGFDEILVSTYSGWVFGLTTDTTGKNLALSVDSNNIKLSQEAKQKILHLRNEVEDLEEKILREREKYHAAAENSENALTTIPSIAVNDKFYLQREDATYNLCIEVQTSIDNVLIQSDVPVDLLDVEKNSAVVSFSDCNPADGNYLLATYRCQLNTTRLDLKIRTIEGQYGTLNTYVTPNIQPKCCLLRSYKIKPLSLHTRIHYLNSKRPYNVLTIKGGFSFTEIHSWIEFCLPEVPEKPPPGDSAVLVFVSTFLDTTLQCTYSKGEAEFKSDNISTISILKDVISKEAVRNNKKQRNLDIDWSIHEESVSSTLNLLRPKLELQLDLLKKIAILKSMSELDLASNQQDVVLTDEYSEIVRNEKKIVEEYRKQPAYLNRLYGMITDLFIDKYKFQGINVRSKITSLLEILDKDQVAVSIFDRILRFTLSRLKADGESTVEYHAGGAVFGYLLGKVARHPRGSVHDTISLPQHRRQCLGGPVFPPKYPNQRGTQQWTNPNVVKEKKEKKDCFGGPVKSLLAHFLQLIILIDMIIPQMNRGCAGA